MFFFNKLISNYVYLSEVFFFVQVVAVKQLLLCSLTQFKSEIHLKIHLVEYLVLALVGLV